MAHVIETASSGRTKCRGCGKPIAKGTLRLGERLPNLFTDAGEMTREPIAKGALRTVLQFFEDARFAPAGFLHPACAGAYFDTDQVADRVAHFSADDDGRDVTA